MSELAQMSQEKVEVLARALYDAFDAEGGGYVGDYKFYGPLTTLDGGWDLEEIIRALEPAFKKLGMLP